MGQRLHKLSAINLENKERKFTFFVRCFMSDMGPTDDSDVDNQEMRTKTAEPRSCDLVINVDVPSMCYETYPYLILLLKKSAHL